MKPTIMVELIDNDYVDVSKEIEDKLIGMSAPLYSDRLSWLSTTNVGEKFNSNYGC